VIALFWFVVIVLSVCYVLRKGKLPIARRSSRVKSWADMSIEERKVHLSKEWDEIMCKIRENHRRFDRSGEIINEDDPARRLHAKDLDKMFKPGFENDPEFRRVSRKLQETMEQNRIINENKLSKL